MWPPSYPIHTAPAGEFSQIPTENWTKPCRLTNFPPVSYFCRSFQYELPRDYDRVDGGILVSKPMTLLDWSILMRNTLISSLRSIECVCAALTILWHIPERKPRSAIIVPNYGQCLLPWGRVEQPHLVFSLSFDILPGRESVGWPRRGINRGSARSVENFIVVAFYPNNGIWGSSNRKNKRT